ncbi:MAG: hypothetical protein PQJ46_01505 [Spirochaetales bacterium]|nr:hypothetical protein [Spirochaetales bacterium]
MTNFLISLALGLGAAAIDTVPMIIKKLDRTFIISAFFVWIALGIIIPACKLIPISWLNGLVTAALVVIPVICLVTKLDREAIPMMAATTVILGSLIGLLSNILIK